MSDPKIIPLVDKGLGNSSYLVDLGDGRALAVDPSRDLRALRATAQRHGLLIAQVAETHLHADFLSGACQLAATDGAQIVAGDGGREFAHAALDDGDELDLGGLTLRALATPGHTFEHLSYLLLDGSRPMGLFTGGSLLVGAAARTDLAGPEHIDELTRAQFRSLRRLAALPADTAVYPTHGAGSFCSAPPGAERTTTIGRELATNPLLSIADENEFARALLDGLGSYPPYFLRLGEVNRRGPTVLDHAPRLEQIGVAAVEALRNSGAEVVDVRLPEVFAAGHLPRSLSIPLRPAFATWLGWLADAERPLVFVRDDEEDPDEIIWQCLKIGYERIAGELDGGIAAWQAAGLPLIGNDTVRAEAVDTAALLDIRQGGEFAAGHIPGARNQELGSVAEADLPPGPLAVMCGHGERAATAASVLERAGRPGAAIVLGGPPDWAEATGRPLDASA
ncbi:MAG TPA: rhodanese-like domain-containing protein [Jatrophihabitantaceae bacterium]|nr:rhodanese-like domain-containing protein [Jatrophihabitantaceae bacterium]